MTDELVVHEDDIVAAERMGLLEVTQQRDAMNMGFDLNDPEEARRMGERGRARVQAEFGYESFRSSLLAALEIA